MLTKRQREVLDLLRSDRYGIPPATRGHRGSSHWNREPRYHVARATLQALVDAGYAEWRKGTAYARTERFIVITSPDNDDYVDVLDQKTGFRALYVTRESAVPAAAFLNKYPRRTHEYAWVDADGGTSADGRHPEGKY